MDNGDVLINGAPLKAVDSFCPGKRDVFLCHYGVWNLTAYSISQLFFWASQEAALEWSWDESWNRDQRVSCSGSQHSPICKWNMVPLQVSYQEDGSIPYEVSPRYCRHQMAGQISEHRGSGPMSNHRDRGRLDLFPSLLVWTSHSYVGQTTTRCCFYGQLASGTRPLGRPLLQFKDSLEAIEPEELLNRPENVGRKGSQPAVMASFMNNGYL